MEFLRIVGLCILAAVVYGVIHDQVTARLCVEYFTIGHAPIIASESPTILGIVWGIVATWWVGLMLGIPLATAARVGMQRRMVAGDLLRPIAVLLVVMGAIAFAAGIAGHNFAARGDLELAGPVASYVPADKRVAFLSVWWAHRASYLAGFLGGIVLIILVIVRRLRGRIPMRPDASAVPPSAP